MRLTFLILLLFSACSTFQPNNYFIQRRGMTFHDYFSHTELVKLWPAITYQDPFLLKKIIQEQKVDINIKGRFNVTLLHWIIGTGDIASTEVILRAGADPDLICYEDTTPLKIAILLKDLDSINLLGRYKANFNLELPKDRFGANTPRHPIASITGNEPEILKAILKFGADPNFYKSVDPPKVYEYNFLYVALVTEDYDEALILLEAGADPLISDSVRSRIIKFFQDEYSTNVNFIKVKEKLKVMGFFNAKD